MYAIGFICITSAAVLLLGMLVIHTQKKQAYRFCENLVDTNINLLDSHLSRLQKGQKIAAEDPRVRTAVDAALKSRITAYDQLHNRWEVSDALRLLFTAHSPDNIYIATAQGECLYSYQYALRPYALSRQDWFQDVCSRAILHTSYASHIHDRSYQINSSDRLCISMVTPIGSGGHKAGDTPQVFLICDIDLGKIMEKEPADISFIVDGYTIGGGKNPERSPYAAEIDDALSQDTHASTDATLSLSPRGGGLTKSLLLSKQSRIFGLRISAVKRLDEITQTVRTILLLLVCTLTLTGILTYFLSKRAARSLSAPIERLVATCRLVSQGDYYVTFEKQPAKEMAVLSDTIEMMIRNIVRLNDRLLEEERMLSEEKLKTLQHQINPHFINNVLQSVKSLALRGDTEKISQISTLLGKNMAYSVYRPYATVTLGEEIEYVSNYMKLQQLRLGHDILFSVTCDDTLLSAPLPKLTLQPLVENSIEHGLQKGQVCIVTLTAETETDSVIIVITDNGQGIPEEELSRLRSHLEHPDARELTRSIGLVNVHERLRKKFGTGFGIEIISRAGKGTSVIVRIPDPKNILQKKSSSAPDNSIHNTEN